MNFSDEEYVRLYVADTVTWKMLEWQGQALLALALRKFDRAGVFEFGRHGAQKALQAALGLPDDVVASGLARLVEESVWELQEGRIFWPKYIDAQTCKRSDRVRQRAARARRGAGQPVTEDTQDDANRDIASRSVTSGHESGSGVTNVTKCHPRRGEADLNSSDPNLTGDPSAPLVAPTKPIRDPMGDSLKGSAHYQRADVKEVFEAWKKSTGMNGAQCDHWANPHSEVIATAIEAYGLEKCLLVARHCMQDGMVNGTLDDKKQKHDTCRYIFGTLTTFERILTDAQKTHDPARVRSNRNMIRDKLASEAMKEPAE
jgi:hypothetical protein